MLKKIFWGIFIIAFLGVSFWLGYYFYSKSKQDPIVYQTEKPFVTTIIKKTVATGSIVPKKEVNIKSPISGIIEALYVEAGEVVKAGQLIAKVKLVPNLDGLNRDKLGINSADNQVRLAKVNYDNAKIEYDRQKLLYEQKVVAQQDYQRALTELNNRKEAYDAAVQNLSLTQQGAVQRSGGISNEVYATIDGILLDVPVKVGSSVIERSNFNEGTTIATIADMNSLIFEGKIDESEVGKLKEGLDLNLTVGAIENKVFKASLEYIAPKGVTEEGAIKFLIKAKILLSQSDRIRAGYSANADIVLEKKEKVMAIKESMLQFGKKDSTFVEVEVEKQKFQKRLIKTGISDGINIEILEGLKTNDKVKVPNIVNKDKKSA